MEVITRTTRRARSAIRVYTLLIALALMSCGADRPDASTAGRTTDPVTATLPVESTVTSATVDSSTSEPTTTIPSLLHVRLAGVEFDVPGTWFMHGPGIPSSMMTPMGAVSTDPFPCASGVTGSGCGDVVHHLSPGGVLATWITTGRPNPEPVVPDPNRTIGGYPAKVTAGGPGNCTTQGAVSSIEAQIDLSQGQLVTMLACFGPDNRTENEQAIEHMLDTAHFIYPGT